VEAIDHVDHVVSSLERSLPFCRELLGPRGAEIESGPREYAYTADYYALFLHHPDGIKLEIGHRSPEKDLVRRVAELGWRLGKLEG
jgi:catechol 2,3-dioxygenase-like lactoylglutathione lyase family enzyme